MKRGLVLLFACSVAHADDAQDACMTQADRGQALRDKGQLVEAREQFLSCARDPCASVISKQCAMWLQGVDAQIPTVAFRAKGADGKDIVAVRVLVDGKPLAQSLDGQLVVVNPGVHTFTYQHEGDADVQEIVLVRAGEKNRPIDIQLAAPPPKLETPPPTTPEPQTRPFRVPLGAGLTLAGGGAAVVVMGILVGVASDGASRMRRTCAPFCPPSDVDGVRAKIAAANVALGVGIAAVAVATIWLIFANTGARAKNAAMEPVLRFE